MSTKQLNFFSAMRSTFQEQEELTIKSMSEYGPRYKHWVFAFSGGKDSTTVLTYVTYLIESEQIDAPESITVCYADAGMEITPLYFAAMQILDMLKTRGINVRIVKPEMDYRYFVYILGRGVPPPSNSFRWCTQHLKIEAMMRNLRSIYDETGEKFLLLTGIRQGESAVRDGRIAMSCSKDGGECGQGWYQITAPDDICDKLAPILHWRVCSVWDWLKVYAPMPKYGGWPTSILAEVYGGDDAEDLNARTGCIECPLVKEDKSLGIVIKMDNWSYLSPLRSLRSIYEELKLPKNRLRKTGHQFKNNGEPVKNHNRMGPLIMDARKWALAEILNIQNEINAVAIAENKPTISLISPEEEFRIRELIELNTWPNGWDGTEQRADEPFLQIYQDGSVQQDLFLT